MCTGVAVYCAVYTVVMISAAFPIWIWHEISPCISHPHNPLILPLILVTKTQSHVHKHSGIHGYTLTQTHPSPLSCSAEIDCQPHNSAEGRN